MVRAARILKSQGIYDSFYEILLENPKEVWSIDPNHTGDVLWKFKVEKGYFIVESVNTTTYLTREAKDFLLKEDNPNIIMPSSTKSLCAILSKRFKI